MQKSLKPALAGLPAAVKKKVEKTSEDIHRRYVRFMDKMKLSSIYKLMASRDYIFLYYAVQGLTNKEIADRLHMSVGTVGKRYGDIYALLGVENKHGLLALYNSSVGTMLK